MKTTTTRQRLYDFRPGLPLEGFWSVFVHEDGGGGAVAAAAVKHRLEQTDLALEHWRQAVRLNAWMFDDRRHPAVLLSRKQSWDEVREQARQWLRLAPASIEARMLWITCPLR